MSEQESAQVETVENETPDTSVAEPEAAETEEAATGEEEVAEDGQEAEEGEEGEGEEAKGPKKLTAQERIQQLANATREAKEEAERARAEAAEIKAAFQKAEEERQAATKNFVDIDFDKVNADIAAKMEQIEELRLEGTVDSRIKARAIEREIARLEEAIEVNEKEKARYQQEQEQAQKASAQRQAQLDGFGRAAEFYREQSKIPPEVWDAGGKWVTQQFEKDPVLAAEFRDRFETQGAIPTIKWLHKLAQEGMGKEAEDAKKAKEKAKEQHAGGASAATAATKPNNGPPKNATMDEWVRWREEQIAKGG